MCPATPQGKLFPPAVPKPGTTVINNRVTMLTSEQHRVLCVDGLVVHYYLVGDRMAEIYAAVMLVESGYATQNEVARVLGYVARTLRRARERFRWGGLQALGRPAGRPSGRRSGQKVDRLRDRTILSMKSQGESNRKIARHLGVSETAIRKRLRHLGWKTSSEQPSLLPKKGAPPNATLTLGACVEAQAGASGMGPGEKAATTDSPDEDPPAPSFDIDPLDRSLDRWLATMGLLDDAAPLFVAAPGVPRAGVLLAVPSLVQSGLLSIAREVYGSIGPAFYGLRTTLVVFVLFALLRIKRPEAVKEYAPADLGRIVGLDRAPEVKTLRRKLTRLAGAGSALELGRRLARRRIAERGRALGFLYVVVALFQQVHLVAGVDFRSRPGPGSRRAVIPWRPARRSVPG